MVVEGFSACRTFGSFGEFAVESWESIRVASTVMSDCA